MKVRFSFLPSLVGLGFAVNAQAGEIGHFSPGVPCNHGFAPSKAVLNLHCLHKFAARDRFQGQSIGLNFAIKF